MNERATILWRRVDLPGHEFAQLVVSDAGASLNGIALMSHDAQPCRLEYEIEFDAAWRTRTARIRAQVGHVLVKLQLSCSAGDEWQANGLVVPALQGCIDVDLGFSPSTNLLPIRRLQLAVGDRAAVRAVWVRFPELSLEVLDQTYRRDSDTSYVYESDNGTFRRELTVNAHGFVVDYPDMWRADAAISDARAVG